MIWSPILQSNIPLYNKSYFNSLWPCDRIWWHRSESTLAQVMAWCLQAANHCLRQCWLITSGVLWHSLNSLRPSDAIWRLRSGSTLAQVMACCLTAPSHYLNQYWLIISKVLWHLSEGIIMRRSEDTNQLNKIENSIFRIAFRSPRGQWVTVSFTGIAQHVILVKS